MKQRKTSFRQAFTLIELLITIGIILVLAGILLPAVSYIRQSGYATATSAQIHALESAINAYYATFRAYPGPLPDTAIGQPNAASGIIGNVTGTENLFLGLCGGINANGQYDPTLIGSGPFKTDPVTGTSKHLKPFYDNWVTEIVNTRDVTYAKDYRFREAPPGGGVGQADDSNIPEFMDRYPDSMPLLYMRARVGAPGVADVSTPFQYQYGAYQVNGYTAARGRKLCLSGSTGVPPQHGLGPNPNTDGSIRTFTLYDYLQDPASVSDPTNTPRPNYPNGACRARDTYVIISAGADRIYGTQDDITSFGSVVRN
ncbi:MAG: type II secretion system protein [Tepidisphaeraceae bacterium]